MKIKNPESFSEAFRLGCISGTKEFFVPWIFVARLIKKVVRALIRR